MNYHPTPDGKDPRLWHLANKRVAFKRHLAAYFVVNAFLWALWLLTGAPIYNDGVPWPVWSTVGWGLGVAFHYFGAYVNTDKDPVEQEYQKLQNQNK